MPFAALVLIFIAATGIVSGIQSATAAEPPPDDFVYISGSKGKVGQIDLYRLNVVTGILTKQETVAQLPDPNFLALSPDKKFLYATSNPKNGSVVSFSIDRASGKLTKLNEQPSAGQRSVHVSIEPSGHAALVANYGGNTVAALAIQPDGSLAPAKPEAVMTHTGSGPNPGRQAHPFPHSIYPDPSGRFAYSCDLGTDQIYCYKIDAAHAGITPSDPPTTSTPPGSGPRHMAFSADGKYAYVVCEMGNILLAYLIDADSGRLTHIQSIPTLPSDVKNLDQQTAGEVQLHPNGKFLYASNRGPHSSIALYSINANNGTLQSIGDTPCGGQGPRFFNLDPTGSLMLVGNQLSNSVTIFRIDDSSGAVQPISNPLSVAGPMCIAFLPAH